MNNLIQPETTINKKIETFFSRYESKSFKKNTVLIQADENPKYIYYLESGHVRQYDISEQGNKVVVNIFKFPAFFPMSWAINKTPNQYYFETATNVTIRCSPPEDVIEFLHNNPDVLFDLLRRVFLGTDIMMRRMAHAMGGSAKTRLLYEILLEGHRFGKQQRISKNILINMHVNELAARTGLTRETASRELGKMTHLGIRTNRKGIKIKNFETLENELGNSL